MRRRPPLGSRWTLVLVGAAAMGVAGTYQFVWSSVRLAVGARLGAPESALGTVFTLFIVFQTVSQFPAGWVRDRYGPRIPLLAGAVLLAGGYLGIAAADGLPAVYLAYGLGGVGAGIAYTVSLNTAVKWFDDRRGLATGVVGMAYGGVSFLLIPAVRGRIDAAFVPTVLALGGLAGIVALVAALVLRDPPGMGERDRRGDDPGSSPDRDSDPDDDVPDPTPGDAAEDRNPAHDPDAGASDDPPPPDPGADAENPGTGGTPTTWREAVRTPQFWLLYAVFVVVNGVGLMVIGKVVAYAEVLGLSAAAATASASLVAVSDAGGVVVVGGISDRLGRERTAAATLVASGLCLAGAVLAGQRGVGVAFVALVGATAGFRSPVFAVFPSLVGDYYGEARSSENYAALYTAKLWGGVGGGVVASALVLAIGWSPSFALGAALLVVSGVALVALRPPDLQ